MYEILRKVYYDNVYNNRVEQFQAGISWDQTRLWRTQGVQSLHHYIYAVDQITKNIRYVIYDYLTTQGRGKPKYVISFKSNALSSVSQLKDGHFEEFYTIEIIADDYHLFEPFTHDILTSLDPLLVSSLDDYKYDKILRTQQDRRIKSTYISLHCLSNPSFWNYIFHNFSEIISSIDIRTI